MSFGSPLWLLAALATAGAVLLFWRRADRRRRADLARFASPHLLPDLTAELAPRRRAVKRGLLVAAILLAGAALADPRWGFTWEETQRRGIDVLIALDVSRSMLAQDVVPNRLERAKLAIIDLVERIGGDRVGLIAFAGSAFLQCPLTLDHAAFLEALHALEPGVIETPGSDLASALRTAQEALATQAHNVKLLVLFSDGEDLEGEALAEAQRAAERGIKVYTVGVGSPAGELIPIAKEGGGTEFVKDPSGQFVKSRLDEATLRKVAETTGGFYEPLGQRGEGVAEVYERALAPLPKEDLASRMRRVPIARFQWPLALALVALALEPWLRERRARRSASLVLVLALAAPPGEARAASVAEAERLYAEGRYAEALAAYRAAGDATQDDPRLQFNLGTAAYRAGEYDEAAQAFARALRSAEPVLQERSFYNLGNAQFRLGQTTLEADPQQTIAAWQQAIDAYDGALRLDPQDEDARFNKEFVQRELERLQQRQQQQQQQQEQQDSGENEEQRDSDGEQEQREGEDQERQGEQQQQQQGQEEQPQEQQEQRQAGRENEPREGEREDQAQAPSSGEQQGSPERRDGSGEEPPPDARSAPPRPGAMSPAEARALLDSIDDGEARMPNLYASEAERRPPPSDPERDW